MKKENWVWMPHAGHFILSSQCQFKLNTYVGKYIVSTVGELWNVRVVREIHAKVFDLKWFNKNKHKQGDDFDMAYMKKFGFEDLGYERKYETMVFKAKKTKEAEAMCCPYEVSDYNNIDYVGYSTAVEAYKGHLKLCEKWSKKLDKVKKV